MSNVQKVGCLDGEDILESVLQCGAHRVSILNYGCVIRDWRWQSPSTNSNTSSTDNRGRPLVLGFESFEAYPKYSPSFGIIAGRVANRTAMGRFNLDGSLGQRQIQLVQNEGTNHLHGGQRGLGKRVWQMHADDSGETATLTYHSPDLEQGYPGVVDFTVVYSLTEAGLTCEMQGIPDTLTPINLAQHSYYNLSAAQARIDKHELWLDANDYLPVDDVSIPTGEVASVENTRFDFRHSRTIENADRARQGIDHNLVLRESRDTEQPAAILTSPERDLALDIITDQPGLQLYTGKKLNVAVDGLDAQRYESFAGLCLEPQHFPNALNHPEWPSILHSPENPYRQRLMMRVRELSNPDPGS